METREVSAEDLSQLDLAEDEWEKHEMRPPKPTLSDILLTAEEKQARTEYRLAMSQCCVDQAWRMYRKVINSDVAIEPAALHDDPPSKHMITRMGVLYDPTAGLRMRHLKKKFAHLLDAFTALRHAAYKPYIRCQLPKKMDIDGQRFSLPKVAKTNHPEVYVNFIHPSTFAYKEKWSKTFNRNFVTAEDIATEQVQAETQTAQAEVVTATKNKKKKEKKRDLTVEQFDFEDLPLDMDGNPIGKSVGICEWCGQSILPLPTDYMLTTEWNISALYCCSRYRKFAEAVRRETTVMEAEEAAKHFLLDVSVKKAKRSSSQAAAARQQKAADQAKAKAAAIRGRDTIEGRMKAIFKAKIEQLDAAPEERWRDNETDTLDLPWDPAATRYHNQLRINSERKTQASIDILLGLEEVYTPRRSDGSNTSVSTGSKLSTPSAAAAAPHKRSSNKPTPVGSRRPSTTPVFEAGSSESVKADKN